MVYDMSIVKNVDAINNAVVAIRSVRQNKIPDDVSRIAVRQLVNNMSIEDCERMLNQNFSLPWIPWTKFNGMTVSQIAKVCGCTPGYISGLYKLANISDREMVSYGDLQKLASYKVDSGRVLKGQTCDLAFSNGTIVSRAARKFSIFNPRAVMCIIIAASRKSPKIDEFYKSVLNQICTDDSWILPFPAKPATKPAAKPVKVPEKETEKAVKTITEIVTEDGKDSGSNPIRSGKKIDLRKPAKPAAKPQPVKVTPVGAAEEAFLAFINRLKPGTEIRIVVPV